MTHATSGSVISEEGSGPRPLAQGIAQLAFGPLNPPGDQRQVQHMLQQGLLAVETGDLRTALRHLDIRCRLPFPRSAHFLMRARLRALLTLEGEREDLEAAYALDPTFGANQIAFIGSLARDGNDQALSQALTRLVRTEPELTLLAKVFSTIGLANRRLFLGVTARSDRFLVWAFSGLSGTLRFSIRGEHGKAQIRLPLQRLSGEPDAIVFGAHVDVLTGQAGRFCQIEHVPEDAIVLNRYALARGATLPFESANTEKAHRTQRHASGKTSIIIPIYGDIQATRQCLESLLSDPAIRAEARIICIDDASPHSRLTTWLKTLADRGQIELLRNDQNLGFVGSVNRVLAHTALSDTVLLNADTLLPRGWLKRLKAHAYSEESIGTVTPLTNSGDFLSFPFPEAPRGPMALEAVKVTDQTFQGLFGGQRLTIPTGIGYCLFIKQSCREKLGLLDDHGFLKGYLEEVDYCLRARKLGFRHVCALDTFVGHIGSASFGQTKRAYVVKNSAEILRRYPEHQREMEAFRLDSPLTPFFSRAEAELLKHPTRPRCGIVIGAHHEGSPLVRDAISRAWQADGISPLLFHHHPKKGWRMRSAARDELRNADATAFMDASLRDLPRQMSFLGLAQWHFLDLARIPTTLFEDCFQRQIPFLVTLGEFPIETRLEALSRRRRKELHPSKARQLDLFLNQDEKPDKTPMISEGIRTIVQRAERLILPRQARLILAGDPILALPQLIPAAGNGFVPQSTKGGNRACGRKGQLALVGAFDGVESYGALKRWVQRLLGRGPWEGIVVVGPVLIPMDLLAAGPVTILDESEWANIDDLVAIHDIRVVAHLPAAINFGTRPIHVRRALPCAEFDFMELVADSDAEPSHPRLLASLSDDESVLADRLTQWFSWVSETESRPEPAAEANTKPDDDWLAGVAGLLDNNPLMAEEEPVTTLGTSSALVALQQVKF